MSQAVDHMLLSTLSQHANYAEKQLIKAGDLGACATRVIQSRRKLLRFYNWLFLAILLTPVMLGLAQMIFDPDTPVMWQPFQMSCLIAVMQLPTIISLQASLAKLETIVSLWLLSNTDDADQKADHADHQLVELIASNS